MGLLSTENLKIDKLPKQIANWDKIGRFGPTFDIERELPSGTKINSIFDVTKNSSQKDLRCALYIEWRRHNHFHSDPENELLKQAWE
jgi:hypothetical protein